MFIGLLFMALGLLGVLAGYKMFKIFLSLSGFIIGFNFTLQLFTDSSSILAILVATAVGLFIAIISYTVYKLGIFISLTVIGMEFSRAGLAPLGIQFNGMNELVYLIIGIIFGASALVFQIEKFILIITTTITGAAYFIMGLIPFVAADVVLKANPSLFKEIGPVMTTRPILLVVFVALLVIGLLIQFQSNFSKK